jgi:asparagine synthase (glutamine-hydrolysing)
MAPLVKSFAGSRESGTGDFFRKLRKFSEIATKGPQGRYLHLASFVPSSELNWLLTDKFNNNLRIRIAERGNDLNDFLWNDIRLVLPNDMLHKVDMMSMANSLEVRIPLLDYRIVDYVNRLPGAFKIDKSRSKKLLWDCYSDKLPAEIYNRRKMGFEVPLEKWLKGKMQPMLADLTSTQYMNHQLISPAYTEKLLQSLNNRGEMSNLGFRLWSILVFQYWFMKNNPSL